MKKYNLLLMEAAICLKMAKEKSRWKIKKCLQERLFGLMQKKGKSCSVK